jgi:hypothetical protein
LLRNYQFISHTHHGRRQAFSKIFAKLQIIKFLCVVGSDVDVMLIWSHLFQCQTALLPIMARDKKGHEVKTHYPSPSCQIYLSTVYNCLLYLLVITTTVRNGHANWVIIQNILMKWDWLTDETISSLETNSNVIYQFH